MDGNNRKTVMRKAQGDGSLEGRLLHGGEAGTVRLRGGLLQKGDHDGVRANVGGEDAVTGGGEEEKVAVAQRLSRQPAIGGRGDGVVFAGEDERRNGTDDGLLLRRRNQLLVPVLADGELPQQSRLEARPQLWAQDGDRLIQLALRDKANIFPALDSIVHAIADAVRRAEGNDAGKI